MPSVTKVRGKKSWNVTLDAHGGLVHGRRYGLVQPGTTTVPGDTTFLATLAVGKYGPKTWADVTNPQRTFNMLSSEFTKMLKKSNVVIVDGKVEGRWGFVKRGAAYGIEYLGVDGQPDDFPKNGRTLTIKHFVPNEVIRDVEPELLVSMILDDIKPAVQEQLSTTWE